MNKKQVILLICVLVIAVMIGIGWGIIIVRTGGSRPNYLHVLAVSIPLGLILMGLGITFRDKKDETKRKDNPD